MAAYDFSRLNDKEFEELCADVIACIEKVRVERFKVGKDGGIDGRFYQAGNEIILQCKHYIRTGYVGLISSLKKVELTKVSKLAPHRYIFLTSCNLSPANKNEIKELFKPYIIKNEDIYGLDDIESFLKVNKKIEKKHYKLWLSSINILEHILHQGILGKSDDFIESMKAESKFYYQTSDYEMTVDKLESNGVAIITGAPGVGKTTLANQMCLHYIAQSYNIIYIDNDVDEAAAIFSPEEKQLFYFDDFLGRNYLDALQNKSDSKIINFIKRVNRNKNKRFILTSRSSILNKGKELSEILRRENINNHEYEVHIDNLNKYDKANILYNHLWHSGLSLKYINKIYKNKNYHVIINHKNFNPRIISFITTPDKLINIEEGDYWAYIERNLNNPEEIWGNLFNQQISQEVRHITILTSLNNSPIGEDFLRDAFYRLTHNCPNQTLFTHKTFEDHIRVAVKSTLTRSINNKRKIFYNIFNPSLGDFIINKYKNNTKLLTAYFKEINTSSCIYNLYSLRNNIISEKSFQEIFFSLARTLQEDINPNQAITFIYLYIKKYNSNKINKTLLDKACNIDLFYYTVTTSTLTIIEWILENRPGNYLEKDVKVFIEDNFTSEFDDENLILMTNIVNHLSGGNELLNLIREHVINTWKDDIQYKAEEIDDLAMIYHTSETKKGKLILNNEIRYHLNKYPFTFIPSEISSIIEHCDFDKIIENNIDVSHRSDNDSVNSTKKSHTDYITEIDDLFDRT